MPGPNQHPRRDLPDSYFNWNLRNARVDAGYTLGQLAEKVGVSTAIICFYERLREFPTPAIAEKIAHTLGMELDYLFPEGFKEIIREVRMEREDSLREGSQLSSLDDIDIDNLAIRESPEKEVIRCEMTKSVESVLCDLNYREREILKLKYGIGGGYCYSGEDIGRIFKITREMVRQIGRRAMAKLKHIPIAPRLEIFWNAS